MAEQSELSWIAEARCHIGLAEIPGTGHQPTIVCPLIKREHGDAMTKRCGAVFLFPVAAAGRSGDCLNIVIGSG